MIKRYLVWIFAAAVSLLAACINNDIPDPAPVITHGTADFTRYISVGNSLTSGYADGGLYRAGQQVAFPNLLAGQMQLAGGGSFTSPLFSADQASGTGYSKLTGYDANGLPIITTVPAQAVRGQTTVNFIPVTLYTKYTGDLNNYGVPGIKLADMYDPNYGNYNGYYERLLPRNAGSNMTTYLNFVAGKPFTFYTFWMGNNDVLDYATSDGMTRSRMLTDKVTFQTQYGSLLGSFFRAKGLVVTIPDVTLLPYFHYITVSNLLALAQKTYGPGVKNIYIAALGDNGQYISRIATDADYITLKVNIKEALSQAQQGKDIYLQSSEVLDAKEIALVQDYVNSYNASIKYVANTLGVTVFDAYALLNQLKNGITQDGVTINTNFITGGVFSLDGIHFTPRGNAYVADEMIKVINTKYGSNLPALDISKYKGATGN